MAFFSGDSRRGEPRLYAHSLRVSMSPTPGTFRCHSCDSLNPATRRYCVECGARAGSAPAASAQDLAIEFLTCPDCAHPHYGDEHFCASCGWPVWQPEESGDTRVACDRCGAQNRREHRFCIGCGSQVAEVPERSAHTPEADLEHCPRCLRVDAEGLPFCVHCGLRLPPDAAEIRALLRQLAHLVRSARTYRARSSIVVRLVPGRPELTVRTRDATTTWLRVRATPAVVSHIVHVAQASPREPEKPWSLAYLERRLAGRDERAERAKEAIGDWVDDLAATEVRVRFFDLVGETLMLALETDELPSAAVLDAWLRGVAVAHGRARRAAEVGE